MHSLAVPVLSYVSLKFNQELYHHLQAKGARAKVPSEQGNQTSNGMAGTFLIFFHFNCDAIQYIFLKTKEGWNFNAL